MDFKVAGTREFVTALQLDTKLDGIPASVLNSALTQAYAARIAILDVMSEAIDGPDEMSQYAPRIITVKIPVDKIGEVIGPKGKMINSIQDETGAQISIEDDGTIYIGADNGEAAEAARAMVNAIANPTMPEVGERYLGTVVKTTAFGAFISLTPGRDGLLHISKLRALAGGKRVDNVEDVVSVGQKIQVEVTEIDPRGKLSLSPIVEDEAGGRLGAARRVRRRPSSDHPARTVPDPTSRASPPRGISRPAPYVNPHGAAGEPRRWARSSDRPSRRAARPDRGDADRPVRRARGVGGRRVAGRDAVARRCQPLPRAPAVQGHQAA